MIPNDAKDCFNVAQTQSLFIMVTHKLEYVPEGQQVFPKIFLNISGAGRRKIDIHLLFQNPCDDLFIYIPSFEEGEKYK